MQWQPTASAFALNIRAQTLADTRAFFYDRKALEVETPLIGEATVTDPYIESLELLSGEYLQTSPEYYMKRLIAAGIGDCYQICKAFRQDETGSRHNKEFTLLEWYRLGFDTWQLMEEVADLIEHLLGFSHFDYLSYQDVFKQYIGIDPLTIETAALQHTACQHIDLSLPDGSKDDWLNALMSLVIEPQLGHDHPVFIYDYPPSQASLAKITQNESGQAVASRFELYIQGLELANGFDELTDHKLQEQRFIDDNLLRQRRQLTPKIIDKPFLAALSSGLPHCAGVALGLDRLLMIKLQASSIEQVMSFR